MSMQDNNEPPRFKPVPWQGLESPADVELWIEEHNLSLQQHIGKNETGYGVCFTLAEGGNITMQTHEDAIQLDVDDEASWVTPLISAATGVEAPRGAYWLLPADKLIQLVIGLSSLVASTTLVVGHRFGSRSQSRAY